MDNATLLQLFLEDKSNQEIATKIVQQNMGLIGEQLTQFRLHGDDEAMSWCLEAFYKAMLTYDPKASVFSTYSTVCVRNNLNQLLRVRKLDKHKVSIHCHVPNCDGLTYEDILEDVKCPITQVHDKHSFNSVKAIIVDIYNSYPEGKKKLILSHWMQSGFVATNTAIGLSTGVSHAYVSTILSEFRYKLKVKLRRAQNGNS